MAQAERDARRAKRRARRARIGAAVRHAVRPLDDDDREALTALIRRAAELLSDGDVSAEDRAELKELVEDLGEARSNTP